MTVIIDTHLHIIDQTALRYPWLAGAPALNRDFSYEDYAREAKRGGISHTLHMEVDVDAADIEAETAYVEAKAKNAGSLLRGAIASCRPEETGFGAYLERQRQNPFVKGFRRVLHVMPDELSESAAFRSNIKLLSDTGLPFDLCVLPRQIPKAIALADLAPDVQFVVDHCGVPDIKGGAERPWREHITEIARRTNVIAKISGVVAYSAEDWTTETVRPWVEHTIEAFGWDRVVWGSDWPVCTLGGGLSTWIAATHALIAGASADEKTKLLSANAKRVWRL
jgi:predicted TIM-barrel fold metal-dependent hydrolase